MIDLAILQLKHTQPRLLATRFLPLHLIFLCQKVVLRWHNTFVHRDMEIVVEVGAIAAHPWEGPEVLLLVRRDLLNRCARDYSEGCVLLGELSQVRKVCQHKCAALTTLLGCRFKHGVVDNELGLCAKKIFQCDRAFGALESIVLRHWEQRKSPSLSLDGFRSFEELLLFG